MNFKCIAQLADEQTAKKLQSEDYVNENVYGRLKETDPVGLDDLIRGAVILGIEPVDAPLVDGFVFYLKKPDGGLFAVMIEASEQDDYSFLKCHAADV